MKKDGFVICNKVVYALPPKKADDSAIIDLYAPDNRHGLETSIEDGTLHR